MTPDGETVPVFGLIIFGYHPHTIPEENPLYQTTNMVKEVNTETLKVVLDSWEDLKKMDDYEKVSGLMVMKL